MFKKINRMDSPNVDTVKKQILMIKQLREEAEDRAEQAEAKCQELQKTFELKTEERNDLLKRIRQLESDLESVKEQLIDGNQRLEEANVAANAVEKEKNDLIKKIMSIEEDIDKTEEKLTKTQQLYKEASHQAEENERAKQSLEHRYQMDLLRIQDLEKQLAEAQVVAEVADKRYDEVCQKLAVMEGDLERNEERADTAEVKLRDLEEEVRVLSNTLRSLEVSEMEAKQREINFAELMKESAEELAEYEERADVAEAESIRLQKQIDKLEEDLIAEQNKYIEINKVLAAADAEVQEY